jgi:hypothetical protein
MYAAMVVAGAVALAPVMQVDFRLDGPVPPVIQTSPLQPDSSLADSAQPVPKPAVVVARGFGHDVPLAFAVRQLVPPRLRVTYGDAVDRQIRVSWDGGKPWDQVLRGVAAPLGLHIVISPTAVRITE